MKRLGPFVLLVLSVGASACGEDLNVAPVRNLERPSDMAFVCMAVRESTLTGRAMLDCHPPGAPDPAVTSGEVRQLGTFAFVTSTARGEVGVVDMDRSRLVDLDPALPGFNMVPTGQLPEAIAASPDGCRVATANRGSCDLTVIDTSALLRGTFGLEAGDGIRSQSVVPKTASGRSLDVAPYEVVFLPPPDIQAHSGSDNFCSSDPKGQWRAIVTFPGCGLVALLDLPSGTIVSSVYVRPEGVADAGQEPVCPSECGGGAIRPTPEDGGGSDGGVDPDGGPEGGGASSPAGPLQVGPMALVPSGDRVFVGASNAPFITALAVSTEGLQAPAQDGRITLAEGAGGVTRLRLSVNPWKVTDPTMTGPSFMGEFVARADSQLEFRRFLYAFARDGSMRIVGLKEGENRECDVNVDPTLPEILNSRTSCPAIPADPTAARARRRPLAQGPGLRITTPASVDSPGPVPRDIAVVDLPSPGSGLALEGVFGFVLASNGTVYVVNVDPITSGDVPLAHSFRDLSGTSRGAGPPRVPSMPSRNLSQSTVSFPTRVTLAPLQGPRLEQAIPPEGKPIGLVTERTWAVFPDPAFPAPPRWAVFLTWEGVLSGTERSSGLLEPAGTSAGALADVGANFCHSGVLAGDVVTLSGCQEDTDCGSGLACQQLTPGAPGMCVPRAQLTDDELTRRCSRDLGSRRRYEVVRASGARLELALKLDEVPKTPLNVCQTDADCHVSPQHLPSADGSDPGFQCRQVREGEPPRCVRSCSAPGRDRDCRPGFVCEEVPGTLPGTGALCVEGPPPDPACWPPRSKYLVQAGQSFTVSGGALPTLPVAREIDGLCQPDPGRHPSLANRIPLASPTCSNVPEGTFAAQALVGPPSAEQGWGNPCLFRGINGDEPAPEGQGAQLPVKALFQNPQLRFVLTNLDRYIGDAATIRVDGVGGFIATIVDVPQDLYLSLPVRIVIGPTKTPQSPGETMIGNNPGYLSFPYLYVVDQGRTSTVGGRGQVVRINPRTRSGPPQFDSPSLTTSPFHIQ